MTALDQLDKLIEVFQISCYWMRMRIKMKTLCVDSDKMKGDNCCQAGDFKEVAEANNMVPRPDWDGGLICAIYYII